jgi:drug/metabolite transporter (DMT)-like permease
VKKPSLPLLAFLGCGLIWGSTFLVIRVGNESMPALWACTLRFALAALLLNAILLITKQPWPKGDALKAAVWYGFLEFGVSMPLLYWGEKVVPSGLAAVLYAICPVVAMFIARLLGMEKLNLRRLAAAILAFLGVGVIFWRELLYGGSPIALLSILLAACAAPTAGLMLERHPQNAIGANAVAVLVGLPICLIASLALGETPRIPTTFQEIFPIVYLTLAGSLGAFVLFAWLIQHWRATTVAFLGVLVPVIAVVLGSIVRKESLAPGSLVGAVVVIVGVIIALRAENKADTSNRPAPPIPVQAEG